MIPEDTEQGKVILTCSAIQQHIHLLRTFIITTQMLKHYATVNKSYGLHVCTFIYIHWYETIKSPSRGGNVSNNRKLHFDIDNCHWILCIAFYNSVNCIVQLDQTVCKLLLGF